MNAQALSIEARAVIAIARKDAMAELRGRHGAIGLLFFGAVVIFVFGFALGPDPRRLADVAPGLLWIAVSFAGILAVSRLQLLETDDGALDQLVLFPVERRTIFLGKALAAFGAMLALGLLVCGAVALLYGVDIAAAGPALLACLVLGAIGLAVVGTVYGTLTARMRAREVLLPLLMLPLLAPLLLGAVEGTAAALSGDPLGELAAWLQLVAVFDAVMLIAGAATYGFLLEE